MATSGWVRLDRAYLRNPKIRAVSPQARLLHLASILWTAEHLTDGQIADRSLTDLGHEADIDVRWTIRRARELEAVGLWERNGSGWTIHDWSDMNPGLTRAAVERQRAVWRERQARHREDVTP